jgi:hypothetical protein
MVMLILSNNGGALGAPGKHLRIKKAHRACGVVGKRKIHVSILRKRPFPIPLHLSGNCHEYVIQTESAASYTMLRKEKFECFLVE